MTISSSLNAPIHVAVQDALRVEMDRVDCLIAAVARHREGRTLAQEDRKRLATAQARSRAYRKQKVFQPLLDLVDEVEIDLVLDCLMVIAYGLVRPSKVRSLQLLAGRSEGEFSVPQALLHELLMPDDKLEAQLMVLLSQSAPIVSQGLIRAEGEGPNRNLRPGFPLARFVAGRESGLNPPEGVRLVYQPGDFLPPIFLSPRVMQRLDEIEYLDRLIVERNPGMAGPAVLFTGGPGTGKSFAVYHLAQRMGRPLYQVDLGRVLSKWYGESERNLSRVFGEMSGSEGCILIDEADSILGKRIEVKESRDQTANITVSHLLSILERHRGPVFLTTNLRGNLDTAYTRRFAAIVDFRRPERPTRELIWRDSINRIAPEVSEDHVSTLVRMASDAELTAAEIINATTTALALAMQSGDSPKPQHLARAVMLEKMKGEATFSREDLGVLANYWPEDAEL